MSTAIAFGQVDQVTIGEVDTVFVERTDTLIQVIRDTVFQEEGQSADEHAIPEEQLSGEGRAVASPNELSNNRLMRNTERATGTVDFRTNSLALLVYPTALVNVNFPCAKAGIIYTYKGRLSALGTFGLLTRPEFLFNRRRNRVPEARNAFRGVDLGIEARVYTSKSYQPVSFYIGLGASASLASLKHSRYIINEAGTYSRFREAYSEARQYECSLSVGWEGRTVFGLAFDLGIGLDLGGRGIFTDDALLETDINLDFDLDTEDWVSFEANRYYAHTNFFVRLGVGIGKW